MRDTFLSWREQVIKNLGGLPPPEVKNQEWLYLLKKETRNSIMVEGDCTGLARKISPLKGLFSKRGNAGTRTASFFTKMLGLSRISENCHQLGKISQGINRSMRQ